MSGARAPLLVVVVGGALLFPLQGRLDAAREGTPPPDLLQTLPPGPVLPILALGHRQTAADLLEIRATNFLMAYLSGMSRLRHEHVMRLYDAILTLDPQDPTAYWRAAVYLHSIADRSDLARDVLDRGIMAVPPEHGGRWQLYYERASLEIVSGLGLPEPQRLVRVRRAGALLQEAARQPGCPVEMADIGQRLATRGQERLEGLRFQVRRWEQRASEGEPQMRARAAERLQEARAELTLEALRDVAERYRDHHGQPAQSLIDLARFAGGLVREAWTGGAPAPDSAGHLIVERHIQDPIIAEIFVLPDGFLVAPTIEARALERTLSERDLIFRQRHGRVPTPADLGVDAPPPYLDIEIDEAGVRVRAR